MKKLYYLLFALILFISSCSDESPSSYTVHIHVSSPEGLSLPYENMEVMLTNKDQGGTYSAYCSSSGVATFQVEFGYYTASTHYQTTSGEIFSGRLELLPLLPEGAIDTFELALSRSESSALIIKEIYYAGCTGKLGEEYQSDQYVTLYNNSEKTIYLDGLCIAVIDPPTSTESPWMKYTAMKRIPINDLTWQFPGDGNEYPLAPGTATTIATNAINHTGGEFQHPNSVDLSKVDWGFWDVSLEQQNIAPGVKPMKLIAKLNQYTIMYSLPVTGPALMVFKFQGTTPENYVNNPDNCEPRPKASNQNKRFLMIPKEWVIDCTECIESINQLPFKRVPDELDHSAAYIPDGSYSGKALIRKYVSTSDGRSIYQDTNNSADDLIVTTPTLK